MKKNVFLKQLSALVAMKTLTSDDKVNSDAIEYIISLISPKAEIKVLENEGAKILIASTKKTLQPEIGYLVHVDVVAASNELFALKQKGNVVYGRGVSDMKFSIPIGIALLNELIERQSQLSFSFVVTTDEEVGGVDGAGYLAEVIKWRPKCLIVPDGGDNLRFVKAAKGVAQFRVESLGVAAHASRVWEGVSAVTPLAALITELSMRYKDNNSSEGWKTTVNFGKIAGGISTNQVCDKATLDLDFRYPETDSFSRIEAELQEIVTQLNGQITVSPLATGLPTFTDPTQPIVTKFLSAFEKVYKQKIEVSATYGASDARHFSEYGIPILMIKPNGGDIHMESEWLDVESTMKFYKALRVFIDDLGIDLTTSY